MVIELDQDITAAINSLHCPVTDFIWQVFSNKIIWIPMYLIIIGFMINRLGWKKGLIVVLACACTFVCLDQLATFIQFLVKRERPDVDAEMANRGMHVLEPVYKKYIYGFFSAHAANAMGFAVCSWLGFRNDTRIYYWNYGGFILFWAIMVGISRVFVGKHFFGDVLTGWIVGAIVGYLFALIARKIIQKRLF